MNTSIGIIGLGRLGSALARGLDRAGCAGGLHGFNRSAPKARAVAAQAPTLRLCSSATEVLELCDLVFLWTKPPDVLEILEANKDLIRRQRPLIVTCVIGVPVAQFTDRWAECLPNVNMPVRKGVTALNYAPTLGEPDRRLVFDTLASVGSVHVLPPEEIPFYSALCSCGPALYVTMMELLADTLSARRGYDREFCRQMVRETMLGTLLLQESDAADASEIVARVAHPGGRSEAGVVHLRATLPAVYEAMLQKMRAL
jgi:pyrroline-5-carboxylate reductase